MNAFIRKYRVGTGAVDAVLHEVNQRFASQLDTSRRQQSDAPVQLPAGIISYHAIVNGDTVVTVTLFDTEEHCRLGQRGAEGIRESLAEFDVEEIDTFTGTVMVSRANDAVLTPITC
jgi:hypothetical protein